MAYLGGSGQTVSWGCSRGIDLTGDWKIDFQGYSGACCYEIRSCLTHGAFHRAAYPTVAGFPQVRK